MRPIQSYSSTVKPYAYKPTKRSNVKGRKVYRYDANNNFVEAYLSASAAARGLNIPKNRVLNYLNSFAVTEYGILRDTPLHQGKIKFKKERAPKKRVALTTSPVGQVVAAQTAAVPQVQTQPVGPVPSYITAALRNLKQALNDAKWL